MSQTFTRREFYDLVWSKPMIHLAKEFGVSDVALHKICRKHNIPNPPLGWWAKKAAGKVVKQIPLPEVESDRPDVIIIRNAPAADWKTQAIEVAEEKARSAPRPSAAMPRRGSAIVRSTIAALRRGHANDQGLISVREAGLVPCSVSKQSISRVAELLPKLEAAGEIQGFRLTSDNEPSRFSDGTQTVKFEIIEGYTRRKHELSTKEKSAIAAWQKRIERRDWRYVHDDNYPTLPDWDYSPTGRLSVLFEAVWYYGQPSPRRSFNDGKRQRLEDMVDKIAIGIAVVAAAKAKRSQEEEERAKKREKERKAQEAAARSRYIEDRRQGELTSLLLAQQRFDLLEQLRARLFGEAFSGGESRISVFESWLQKQIDQNRQLLTREGLETHFEIMSLFGQDDDRGFGG